MKIVIVDDHTWVRKGLIAVLEQEEGIEVIGEAETVDEAVQLIEQTKPDLAIVDIRLGDQSGFDLIERLRHRSCRFMMLTSSAAEADIRKAEENGVDGYVLKDSMPEELLLAIKMMDRGRKYFDQGLLDLFIRKEADDPMEKLTPKEKMVLATLGEGLSNGALAKKLMISESTVKKHVSSIFQKLNLNDRTQAALYAQSRGVAAFTLTDEMSDR
ncbi:response regulator transcription factor [Paenibacillus silvisoli]|uniref:response regulator transcription factor n=1 Tax=Paenibacillus silvisoli TaxID=3110539 RepID=UPI002803BDC5|nr:response regulator transcription factor [Paenibacillus silvisoli]